MRLPYAKYTNSPAKIRTIEFKGYCVRPLIADGQMRDMKNLSSDGYPNMTQRKMRTPMVSIFEFLPKLSVCKLSQ